MSTTSRWHSQPHTRITVQRLFRKYTSVLMKHVIIMPITVSSHAPLRSIKSGFIRITSDPLPVSIAMMFPRSVSIAIASS